MTKAIGPTFSLELAAYVTTTLPGQHFSWTSAGDIEFFSDTPAAVVTGVNAVYAAHNPAIQDPNVEFGMAVAAGCAIVSTGTPALNGTYAIDPLTQGEIQAEVLSLLKNGTFTDGSTSLAWPDIAGGYHTFNPTSFDNFATAAGNYFTALKASLAAALAAGVAGGWLWTPPASPVTIP